MKGLAVLVLLLPLAACGGGDDGEAAEGGGGGGGGGRGELTVLAAASLTDVFDELATPFEEEHDADVVFSFGSSTDLAEQVADGAPGDVLATADEASMQLAEDSGATGEVETFALKCPGPMDNSRISCGPSGIRIMKSMMCVNCTAASSSRNDRSERCFIVFPANDLRARSVAVPASPRRWL